MNTFVYIFVTGVLFLVPIPIAFASSNHETCIGLTVSECNKVNSNFATQETLSPKCQVTLADGQLITVYKDPTKTCSTLQDELGSMTYQRYQEEAIQGLENKLSELASNAFK